MNGHLSYLAYHLRLFLGKILPELILPVEQRIAELREFLLDIDNTLQYDIVPIDDPFGPTQHDPDMDMIVVSAETLRGGQKVNEIRASKQLRQLDIFAIDIVESNVHDGIHESKVSSSNTRIDLLGTRWRQPEVNSPHYFSAFASFSSVIILNRHVLSCPCVPTSLG